MALYFSNHQSLIKDCYPLKQLLLTPLATLRADSNSLSKLTFYASGRPKKLPKVATVVMERAERDARTSGARARADLVVTVDIMRGLVEECRHELRCFASQAMRVVVVALGRRLNGTAVGERDTEMEARAAGLFHAIAVFTTGPFLGLDDELARQYLDCLSVMSGMAQLGSEHPTSRWIALSALEGAINSEVLYAVAADFNSQINLIVPALLFNCLRVSIADLQQMSNSINLPSTSSTSTSTRLALKLKQSDLLSPRTSPRIVVPASPPTPSTLALLSVESFLQISNQSHAAQLSSTLTSMSKFFDLHSQGIIWTESAFINWVGLSGLAATPVQYRAAVVQWWTEQVVSVKTKRVARKHLTLAETLRGILKGPTSLLGLGIGNVCGQLVKLVVARATLSSTSTEDSAEEGDEEREFLRLLIQTISALGSHVYYLEQMNDLVSDLIDTIRLVKNSRTGAGGASTENLVEELQRNKAARVLVVTLRELLNEARGGVSKKDALNGAGAPQKETPKPKLDRSATATPGTVVEEGEGTIVGTENGTVRPGLFRGEGTVRGNDILANHSSLPEEPLTVDDVPLGSEPRRPSIHISRIGQPSPNPSVSPEVFKESLFLLTDADLDLRKEYESTLLAFVKFELEVALSRRGGAGTGESSVSPDDIPRFLAELHSAIFQLATSTSSLPSPSHSASTSTSQPPSAAPSPPTPRSSRSSRRVSSLILPPSQKLSCLATPTDYAFLREVLTLVQSHQGTTGALFAGVPMLIALERESAAWAEGEEEHGPARSQACRELVGEALVAVGKTWGVGVVESIGNEMLAALGPSVLPELFDPERPETNFNNAVVYLPFNLDTSAIFDALSNSSAVQAVSGSDRAGISSVLDLPWTPDGARNRTATSPNLYRSGSRSVTNSSVLRVSTTPEGSRSIRAPSLADLQLSLGRGSGSLASATPSIASTNGTFPVMDRNGTINGSAIGFGTSGYSMNGAGGMTVEPRQRRTTKSMTSAVLGRVAGLRSGSSSSRLSASPPYLVSNRS